MADVYELLTRELGGERVVRAPEALEVYGRDESRLGVFPPDAAVLCESRAEIELVLRLAAEHGIPVTPRGAGSGMTGGALPVRGGIVLSTERMRRIIDINVDDRVAVVEPGVINGDLQAAVEAQGLFYPPDPASLGFCSMGGNVAENAGGPRAFKYGVTRDWTLGLTATLMGGETLRLGRRTPKGVTGYDLTALFVGSEGTFGVTSEITVRLVGRPEGVGTFIAVMPDAVSAGRAVSAIIRKGHRPRALELLDKRVDRSRAPEGGVHASRPTRARSCWSSSTASPTGSRRRSCAAARVCEAEGARDVIIARDDADRERLWKTRRVCSVGAARGVQVQAVGGHGRAAELDPRDAPARRRDRRAPRSGDGDVRPRRRRQPAHQPAVARDPARRRASRRASTRRWRSCSRRRSISAARCRASTASASPRRATWRGSSRPR